MNAILYIGIALAAVAAVGVFLGPLMAAWVQERKRERDEKLKIHFEHLQIEVMNPVRNLSWDIQSRDGELVYGGQPFLTNYEFEQREPFVYFSLHFPEMTEDWNQLKEKALRHNHRYNGFMMRGQRLTALLQGVKDAADARGEEAGFDIEDAHGAYEERVESFNDDAQRLVQEFEEFSSRLATEIDNISLYEMGKRFKKHPKCPICQKF